MRTPEPTYRPGFLWGHSREKNTVKQMGKGPVAEIVAQAGQFYAKNVFVGNAKLWLLSLQSGEEKKNKRTAKKSRANAGLVKTGTS